MDGSKSTQARSNKTAAAAQQQEGREQETQRKESKTNNLLPFAFYCSLIPPEPTFELEGTKSTIDNIIDSYYKLYKMTVVIDSQQPINAVHIDGLVSPKL